jgi:methylmalonyl-CoA/ethylmalonyl-CoA epimerase
MTDPRKPGAGRALRVDHVGIAVRSLAERVPLYRDLLGVTLDREEEVPTERVRVAFLGDGETHVELLEPLDGEGPIAQFLAKRGEGVHHLCFAVDDIEAAVSRLRAEGVTLVGEAPRPGAGGCRVAFLHPKGTGGVLIELSEKPRK